MFNLQASFEVARLKYGIRKQDIAKRVGCTKNTVSTWSNINADNMTINSLGLVADAVGMTDIEIVKIVRGTL